jgi:NhaP-type Na+/H+ or K+/H+ antiporter
VLAYFASLGAGYLLVEAALIQRLTLLLERPALSLAFVLPVLLLSSGIGSLLAQHLTLRPTLAALVGCLALLTAVLPGTIRQALPWAWNTQALLAALLLAPPGFLMGISSASGLRRPEARSTNMIAWAWATDGAASGRTVGCGVGRA